MEFDKWTYINGALFRGFSQPITLLSATDTLNFQQHIVAFKNQSRKVSRDQTYIRKVDIRVENELKKQREKAHDAVLLYHY